MVGVRPHAAGAHPGLVLGDHQDLNGCGQGEDSLLEAGGVLVGKPLLEECSLLPREGVVLGQVQVFNTVKVVVLLRQPAENIRILVRVGGRVIGLAWVLDLNWVERKI